MPEARRPRLFSLVTLVCALAAGLPAFGQAAKQKFDVASDLAERSLKTFALQSGVEVIFSTEVTGGVRTNAVKGEFSPIEAAQRMLAGTRLEATQQSADGAIVVSRKSAPPEKNDARAAEQTANDRPNQNRSNSVDTSAPIELSPFTVNSSQDIGYVANNTLAGSRLNTSLKDTAATISVMTEEFLADIGAFSVSDAMLYAGNLQIDQEETVNGTPTGNLMAESFPTYRVRGMKATVARNYFSWNVPGNTYNIERIDESRGPNSVLFGVGAAGGIINSSTKQAQLGRARQSASFSYGSFDSMRGTIDVNQPVIKNVLALRLNGLWSDTNTSREYSDTREKRGHLTALYQPFRGTRVRAEFERGETLDHVTRPWPVIDMISLWNARGRPVRLAQAASAPDGIARLAAGTTRITYVENDNRFIDMKGTMTSTAAAAQQNTMIIDRNVADYSVNPAGPGARRDTRFTDYMATLEQKLPLGQTFVSLAFNHQQYDFVGHDVQQDSNTLWGDPNQTIPTSMTATAPNPFAGRYYVEGTWTRRHRNERFNTLRATLSNEFDLEKWGRYRWAGMAEEERSGFVRHTEFEAFDGRPFNAVPQNPANRVFRRYYVTEGDWSTYRIPAAVGNLIVSRTDPVTGRTLSTRWVQGNANIDDDKARLRTLLVGGQASWFKHRLIGTFGFRRDLMRTTDRGTLQDSATGEFVVDYGNVTRSTEKGTTRTLGAVLHLTPQISATYNRSTNTSLANNAHRVLPDSEKAAQGEGVGEDVGLSLDLLGGRIFAKATYYTTAGKGETDFRSVSVLAMQRTDRVMDALINARAITAAEAATHRVLANGAYSDRESSGWEFRLVANPTTNLRVQANYSITEAVESNIMPEVVAWAATETAYWRRFNTALTTSSGITLAQEILNLQDDIETQTSADGLGAIGNRRYKGNVFGRYDFSQRWLKGAFVGGGYRYQGKMLIGRNLTTGALAYTGATVKTDALIGYRFKLPANRGRGTLQLNIDNLLDDTEPVILRRTDAGFVRRFSVAEPRTYRLSTSVTF